MSTAIGLSAELNHQIELVGNDKSSLKKILDFVKNVLANREAEKAAAAREKAETLENIRAALLEFKDLQAGKGKWISEKEFKDELRREGYYD